MKLHHATISIIGLGQYSLLLSDDALAEILGQSPANFEPFKASQANLLDTYFDHTDIGINPAVIWPTATVAQQVKFLDLIRRFEVPLSRIDGRPMPRRKVLFTDDYVVDPFTGDAFTMLRRRLNLRYNLTAKEVRLMFNLSEEEFTDKAPAFSREKARRARQNNLGHHQKA